MCLFAEWGFQKTLKYDVFQYSIHMSNCLVNVHYMVLYSMSWNCFQPTITITDYQLLFVTALYYQFQQTLL